MLSHRKKQIESIQDRLADLELEHLMILNDLLNTFGSIRDDAFEDEENLDEEFVEDDFDDNDSLGEFTTDLMAIVKDADIELVKYILDNRKMIMINAKNEKGTTPLMWACAYNACPEVIEELIKHKAKIDAKDNNGRTALHHLAGNFNGNLILEPLIKAGADLNAKDDNENTPLKLAINAEAYETVLALLKAGANIEDLDI